MKIVKTEFNRTIFLIVLVKQSVTAETAYTRTHDPHHG